MANTEGTYQFATGEKIAKALLTPGQRQKDRMMAKIWKQAGKVVGQRDKLEDIVQEVLKSAYKAAKKDGRKQVTFSDPTNLRRVTIKHQTRITLEDSAWSAKSKIDNYIEEHTKTRVDTDTRNILEVLRSVFTGRKTLTWNAAVQQFIELTMEDPGLREAQRIIKAAKRVENSRDYMVLEERPSRSEEWEEVARY